jgi:hypothetical protein
MFILLQMQILNIRPLRYFVYFSSTAQKMSVFRNLLYGGGGGGVMLHKI